MAHFKNSKDANLAVGAVLLIAVMVAVSVAVDTLTVKTDKLPQIEELTVSSFNFSNGTMITVVVENNGTAPSEIAEVWINNEQQAFTANSTVIPPKDCIDLSVMYTYSNSTNYHCRIVSERGSTYLFTVTAL
jgi:hypothetical protein